MMAVKVLFAFASVLVATASDTFLGNAKALRVEKEASPKPRHHTALQDLKLGVSSLENDLVGKQYTGVESIKKKKAERERQLQTQREENYALHEKNDALNKTAHKLAKINVRLRNRATRLKAQHERLLQDFDSIKGNMDTAQDFLGVTLNESTQKLFNSSDVMSILDELKEADAKSEAEVLARQNIDEIAGASEDLSFLQVKRSQAPAELQELLSTLSSEAEGLDETMRGSEESLENAFAEKFRKGEERHAQLLQVNVELNAQVKDSQKLKNRLTNTVKKLSADIGRLTNRQNYLKSFISRLGA